MWRRASITEPRPFRHYRPYHRLAWCV